MCTDCDLLKFTRCPLLTEVEARRHFLLVDPPTFRSADLAREFSAQQAAARDAVADGAA